MKLSKQAAHVLSFLKGNGKCGSKYNDFNDAKTQQLNNSPHQEDATYETISNELDTIEKIIESSAVSSSHSSESLKEIIVEYLASPLPLPTERNSPCHRSLQPPSNIRLLHHISEPDTKKKAVEHRLYPDRNSNNIVECLQESNPEACIYRKAGISTTNLFGSILIDKTDSSKVQSIRTFPKSYSDGSPFNESWMSCEGISYSKRLDRNLNANWHQRLCQSKRYNCRSQSLPRSSCRYIDPRYENDWYILSKAKRRSYCNPNTTHENLFEKKEGKGFERNKGIRVDYTKIEKIPSLLESVYSGEKGLQQRGRSHSQFRNSQRFQSRPTKDVLTPPYHAEDTMERSNWDKNAAIVSRFKPRRSLSAPCRTTANKDRVKEVVFTSAPMEPEMNSELIKIKDIAYKKSIRNAESGIIDHLATVGNINNFRHILRKQDGSGSGYLNFTEFQTSLAKAGISTPSAHARALFTSLARVESGAQSPICAANNQLLDIERLLNHLVIEDSMKAKMNTSKGRDAGEDLYGQSAINNDLLPKASLLDAEQARVARKILHAASKVNDPLTVFRGIQNDMQRGDVSIETQTSKTEYHRLACKVSNSDLRNGLQHIGASLNDYEFEYLQQAVGGGNQSIGDADGNTCNSSLTNDKITDIASLNHILSERITNADISQFEREHSESIAKHPRYSKTYQSSALSGQRQEAELNTEYVSVNDSKINRINRLQWDKLKSNLQDRYSFSQLQSSKYSKNSFTSSKSKPIDRDDPHKIEEKLRDTGLRLGPADSFMLQEILSTPLESISRPLNSNVNAADSSNDSFTDVGVFASSYNSRGANNTYATTMHKEPVNTSISDTGAKRKCSRSRPDCDDPHTFWNLLHHGAESRDTMVHPIKSFRESTPTPNRVWNNLRHDTVIGSNKNNGRFKNRFDTQQQFSIARNSNPLNSTFGSTLTGSVKTLNDTGEITLLPVYQDAHSILENTLYSRNSLNTTSSSAYRTRSGELVEPPLSESLRTSILYNDPHEYPKASQDDNINNRMTYSSNGKPSKAVMANEFNPQSPSGPDTYTLSPQSSPPPLARTISLESYYPFGTSMSVKQSKNSRKHLNSDSIQDALSTKSLSASIKSNYTTRKRSVSAPPSRPSSVLVSPYAIDL